MIHNPRPFPPEDPDCELCEAARFTHWYAETEHGWVADCEICSVPMVVWWHHGTEPDPEEVAALHEALAAAADERFGPGNWRLDTTMRQIPTHFHAHARDKDWLALRFQRPLSRYTGVGTPRRTTADD
ncbi:MAG: hypothetical protein AAF547_07690 [Actinomycetota bacterium]